MVRPGFLDISEDFPDDNFVLTKEPTSYVTIDYHDGVNGPVTGSLKIVVIDEPISTKSADNAIYADNGGVLSDGAILGDIDEPNNKFKGVYYTILQTNTVEYPVVWKDSLQKFAKALGLKNDNNSGKVFTNKECVKYIKQFYDDMKSAMPGLMSYRYQTQVFGECVNSLGKPLDGYGDKENTIIAKAIPVMDVSKLKDVFV